MKKTIRVKPIQKKVVRVKPKTKFKRRKRFFAGTPKRSRGV